MVGGSDTPKLVLLNSTFIPNTPFVFLSKFYEFFLPKPNNASYGLYFPKFLKNNILQMKNSFVVLVKF